MAYANKLERRMIAMKMASYRKHLFDKEDETVYDIGGNPFAKNGDIRLPNLKCLSNEWIVAPSSYGKSIYAREKYPDYFEISPCSNVKYYAYTGQSTILLDDYGPKQMKRICWFLKQWADLYSYLVQTEDGLKYIRPLHIVVTSQYEIEACFPKYNNAEQVKRRFNVTRLTRWQDRV